jgi:hypothetical protein
LRLRNKKMERTDAPITLGRGLLAGLLTGLLNAVIIIIFNVLYRRSAEFYAFEIVMPVTIFMVFPLFDLLAGGVYFLFVTNLHKGPLLFRAVFILLTLIGAGITALTGQGETAVLGGFRGLFFGIELICGGLTALLLPYLAQHPRLYLTSSDIKGEE